MAIPVIILATPHARYDLLEQNVRESLGEYDIVRIRSRSELTLNLLEIKKPKYIFFPHWSWKINEEIYKQYECIIFHMTDLPYGRGGSPLQNLIVRGHQDTQISALRCEEGVDAGPVYLKHPLSLEGTAEDIFQRASVVVGKMILEIITSRLNPIAQEGDVVEFKRRTLADSNLNEVSTVEQAYDYIRMLDADGYPPAFLETEGLYLEFSQAQLSDGVVEATVKIRDKVNG